jgi:hypothetical protein
MNAETLHQFLAGFELAGEKLPNGKIRSTHDRSTEIDEWPQEIKLFGNTYVLEDVEEFPKSVHATYV